MNQGKLYMQTLETQALGLFKITILSVLSLSINSTSSLLVEKIIINQRHLL